MFERIFGTRGQKARSPVRQGAFKAAASVQTAGIRAGLQIKGAHKKTILVAEASDDFAAMLRRAFREAGLPHMLRRVRDGAEALRYIAGQDEFADRQRFPYPDLLVVGSVLPRIGGVELLGYLRGEMGLRTPVVIFSHTLSAIEMRRALELGEADYFVRPDAFPVLLDEVSAIERSWLAP
jgi:DNA-binding response OmpR family regulator